MFEFKYFCTISFNCNLTQLFTLHFLFVLYCYKNQKCEKYTFLEIWEKKKVSLRRRYYFFNINLETNRKIYYLNFWEMYSDLMKIVSSFVNTVYLPSPKAIKTEGLNNRCLPNFLQLLLLEENNVFEMWISIP